MKSYFKKTDLRLLRRAISYTASFKFKFAITILLLTISIVISLVEPMLWAKLITSLFDSHIKSILLILITLGILMICELVFQYLGNYMRNYLNENLLFVFKQDMYKKLLDLPIRAFDKMQVGEFMSRIHNDAGSVAQALTTQLLNLIISIFKALGIGIIVFTISIPLGIVLLITFPLSSLSFFVFGKIIRKNNEERAHLNDSYFGDIQQTIQGIREVKSLGLKEHRLKSFLELAKQIKNLNIKQQSIISVSQNISQGISFISHLAVLFIGSYFVIHKQLSMESFIAFGSYTIVFIESLTEVTRLNSTTQQIMTSLERMFKLMDNLNYSKEAEGTNIIVSRKGVVSFRNVSFEYEDSKPVLKNISLEIGSNRIISFVGKSGSGKTTLFNLLLRFYLPNEGDILIDGVSLSDIEENSLRKTVTVVRQDIFLFHISIKDNLRLVNPEASNEEVENACKLANIHDFILTLSNGYDTIIEDNSVNISCGQRQRIAIARALLSDAKIILFDEATSSLDNESQYLIRQTLDLISKSRTVIMIAHRLLTVVNSDEIILLDNGTIAGRGTHQTLIDNNEVYRNLYTKELEILNSVPGCKT